MDKESTDSFLSLNGMATPRTIANLTGHCSFGRLAKILGIPVNNFCLSCRHEEEKQIVFHIKSQCSTFIHNCSLHFFGHDYNLAFYAT